MSSTPKPSIQYKLNSMDLGHSIQEMKNLKRNFNHDLRTTDFRIFVTFVPKRETNSLEQTRSIVLWIQPPLPRKELTVFVQEFTLA